MQLKSIAMCAGFCGTMMVSGEAEAVYIGLGMKLHSTVTISGTARNVWRVYAVFDNPDDCVTAVGGSEANGPATVTNLNAAGDGPGTGFFNAGGGSGPPGWDGVPLGIMEWDTFVTLGLTFIDKNDTTNNNVALSPGFPLFTPGQTTTTWGPYDNVAWFTAGPKPQGKAGNGVAGPFLNNGSPVDGMGVLIMQLTVNAGQHVAGTVFVNGELGGALAGNTFTATGQTFSSVPAPGAVAMLGMAGLVGARRRRA